MSIRAVRVGYDTYEEVDRGVWESTSADITFVTAQMGDGLWWCGSSPKYTFDGISAEVDDYTFEDGALRAAVDKYYQIRVRECEYQLHRMKTLLKSVRDNT